MTGHRLNCHCAAGFSAGRDIPHVCAAWSDQNLTELRARHLLPAPPARPGLRGVPTWAVAAILILLVMLPLSLYGVLSAPV